MKLGPALFLFRNPSSDLLLLMKAFLLVSCVRLGLSLLPFRVLRQMLAGITSRTSATTRSQPSDLQTNKKIASSVRRASRYVPAATCLTQALATQVLLIRRGQIATLSVGVTKDGEGELKAHAWVVSNGKIVLGQRKDLRSYTVLSRLEEVSQ